MASGADLLEQIRRSPHGRSQGDLERLLKAFGFMKHAGKKHLIFRHELLPPGMVVTVPRHRSLRSHVARKAVKAIDLVLKGQKGGADGE